jgi:hypothetical protein
VKDLRTEHETSDVQSVLDGDLDSFIEAYLLKNATAPQECPTRRVSSISLARAKWRARLRRI